MNRNTKTGSFIVVFATLALIVACGPKSRYRAKEVTGLPLSTDAANKNKSNSGTQSPIPDSARVIPEPAEPTDEVSQQLAKSIETLSISQIKKDDQIQINLIVSFKSDKIPHLVLAEGPKDSIQLTAVKSIKPDGSLVDEVKESGFVATFKCKDADENCENLNITIGKADSSKVEITAHILNQNMLVKNATEGGALVGDFKDLVEKNEKVAVQLNTMKVAGRKHFSLVIATKSPLIVQVDEEFKALNLIYGKKLADSVSLLGKLEAFNLGLKSKDKVISELQFSMPTPPASSAEASNAGDNELFKLTCSQNTDGKFLVKIQSESKAHSWNYKVGDKEESAKLEAGKKEVVTAPIEASEGLKVVFSTEIEGAGENPPKTRHELPIVLSKDNCPSPSNSAP